jgi:tetratricopeptide (TPR) repeat protein
MSLSVFVSKSEEEKGLSLATAYTAADEKEAADTVAAHRCTACGQVGQYVAGDKGKKKRLDDLYFFKIGMWCRCGFINFVYLIVNDIDRNTNKRLPSTAEALNKAKRNRLLQPASFETRLAKTKALAFKGEIEQALQTAQACAADFPDRAPALYNYGCLLGKVNRHEQALTYLAKTLELDAGFYSAWYQQGLLHQELGNVEQAVQCFDQFLRQYPRHADALKRKRECQQSLSAEGE